MKDYHINLFYSEEDEGYIADIPDLKHCSAFGSTPEEALREVLKARAAWLEAAREHGSLSLNLAIVLSFIKWREQAQKVSTIKGPLGKCKEVNILRNTLNSQQL